jgi:anti-sigma factor RsiW
MTSETGGDECYTDFALQEYIAGRLDAGVRRDLEEHLARCRECRGALQAFQAEAALLRGALAPRGGEEICEEVTDETLALYMGGALDQVQVAAVEDAVSRRPALLGRLVALGREVAAVREGAGSPGQESRSHPPEGLILKMRRRTVPPATVSLPGRLEGGMGA